MKKEVVMEKVKVSIDKLVELINSLDEESKYKLLEKLFVDFDTSPLTDEERKIIKEAERDLKEGKVIEWNGK